MTPIEKKLAVHMLKGAADSLSNNGCNDFDLHEHMDPDQAIEFARQMYEWNGDKSEEFDPEHAHFTQDWFVARFLAARLEVSQ